MSNKYQCAYCKGIFDKGWSDEEAETELEDTFGLPKEMCDIVCDDCYKAMGFGNAEQVN